MSFEVLEVLELKTTAHQNNWSSRSGEQRQNKLWNLWASKKDVRS